jgi:hypothetical protein
MSYAYTPGLKVKKSMTVRRSRILPVSGKVLVQPGDRVSYDTKVAETFLPGEVVEFSVMMRAPLEVGDYSSYWKNL